MSKQLTSKNTFLCAIGAVTASHIITAAKDVIVNPKVTTKEYKDAGVGAGSTKSYLNEDLTTAEFSVDVTARAAVDAGEKPAYSSLLRLCGLKETITADTSVVYTPELIGELGTAKAYLDGEYRSITGIAGSFKLSAKIGELAEFNFSLKGFTTIEPSIEANPEVVLDSNDKLLMQQATAITENGTAIDLQSFELDAGMEIEQYYGAETKEYYIKDFKPTIKIKAIKTKGNNAHWAQLKANTVKEVIVVLGNIAGKTLEIKASYCNASDVSESDDKGIIVFEKTYICEANVGKDNFSLTYK